MTSGEPGAASPSPLLTSRASRRALLAGAAALLPAARAAREAAAQSDQRLTRAGRWVEASEVGVARAEAIGDLAPEPIAFQTPYRVFAAAPHWSGKEKPGATLEVSFSADGATWTDPVTVGEDGDNGRPGKDRRRYGPLLMTGPAEWIRYRSFNAAGRPAALRGLAWEDIDASNGADSLETAQRGKRDRDRVRDASDGSGSTAAAGTVTVKVQHSSDNLTYADLITFSNVTAAGAQRATVTGTVNRYTRVTYTATSGTATFVVGFGRS